MVMKIELLNACDQWFSATLNGLYQGLVVAALAALGLRLVGSTNAATRHAIWLATLVVVVALLPAHYCCSHLISACQAQQGDNVLSTALLEPEPSPAITIRDPIAEERALADSNDPLRLDAELNPPVTGKGELVPEKMTPSTRAPEANVTDSSTSVETIQEGFVRRLIRLGNPASWSLPFASMLPRGTSLVLVAVWLGGAGARLSRLGWRFGQLRVLKDSAFPPQSELSVFLRDLRKKLGVQRNVELRLSNAQRCPVALGFLHPVILLPAHEVQPVNLRDAEPILQHELAHVSRHDDWANLAQQVIQAILFFHPAVWWISKQLALEREVACDDWVLHQGGRPRAYALMLADMAGRLQSAHPLLAPVISSSKSQLQQRINMILNTHRNTSPRLAKVRLGIITSATAGMALVAVYSWPRIVLAENRTAAVSTGADALSAAASAVSSVNAVDSDSADAPSAALAASPEVSPGPKFKPEPNSEDATPTPPVPPVAPVPPIAPTPATPPALGDLPLPPTPRPGRAPDAQRRVASLEERLARVERMLEKLLAKQKDQSMPFQPGAMALPKGPDDNDAFPRGERGKRAKEKEMEYAAKESARAAKLEAKQRERELQRSERGAGRVEFGTQLEALHKEREALQREVEKLDQKIERLEHDQERLEKEKDRLEKDQERQEKDQERQEQDREKQREQEKQGSGLNWPDKRGKQDNPATVTVGVAATAPVIVTTPVKLAAPIPLTARVNLTAPVTTTITTRVPSSAPETF
jgi:beta-lactamase regulating signal transducer with metallopeptidase domain